ncbi:MAG: glycosyltransferase family 39 protein [Anaerolineae bacterium]
MKRETLSRWMVLVILVLALALRFYRLEAQSLWYDEGTSVAMAGRGLATITRHAAADIHPPLYYYLLHFWVLPFGTGEAAIRALSALTGTALVALTYLLGRRLFGITAGLVAALLSALSPFQVYYSQETRMYILVALLGALSVYLFLWIVDKETSKQVNRGRGLIYLFTYLLVTIFSLYTHYFAFTILLVENLGYGAWLIARRPGGALRLAARWAALQLAIVALYLPWLAFTWEQLQRWPAISPPFSLAFLAREVLRVFSLGLSVEPKTTPVVLGFALILGLGCVPWKKRREGTSLAVALIYLVVPVLAMYFLSLRRPMYDPKFLLLATPAYYLLLARGVLAPTRLLARRSLPSSSLIPHPSSLVPSLTSASLIAFLIVASARSLHSYYFDPRYARDDYRGMARYIEATARPGDAVILNAPSQIEIFSYYYQGDLALYPLPRRRPPDEGETRRELEEIAARHGHLYAILWATDESDPGRIVEGWLDEHAYKALDTWYGNVRLVLYATPQAASTQVQHPLKVTLGDRVELLGYSLGAGEVMAGDVLPLTLHWRARARIEERYKVFVHLLDAHDHIVGQRDTEPGGGSRPTTAWPVGEEVTDRYGVLVLPGTPPGAYRLEVGMYSPATGVRLPVSTGGDRVLLEPVRVSKPQTTPSPEALRMGHPVNERYGPITLLGYDLSPLGREHEPRAPLHPGDVLHLTLYWEAAEASQEEVILSLQVVAGNRVWAEWRGEPLEGEYPPSRWEAGEVVRDQHNIALPPDLPSGRYQLLLRVMGPDGELLGRPLGLGPFTVE